MNDRKVTLELTEHEFDVLDVVYTAWYANLTRKKEAHIVEKSLALKILNQRIRIGREHEE